MAYPVFEAILSISVKYRLEVVSPFVFLQRICFCLGGGILSQYTDDVSTNLVSHVLVFIWNLGGTCM